MAERFEPIRFALAAFSCFTYTIQTRTPREDLLWNLEKYYMSGHKYLERLENECRVLVSGEIEMAVATALVLATLHVSPNSGITDR